MCWGENVSDCWYLDLFFNLLIFFSLSPVLSLEVEKNGVRKGFELGFCNLYYRCARVEIQERISSTWAICGGVVVMRWNSCWISRRKELESVIRLSGKFLWKQNCNNLLRIGSVILLTWVLQCAILHCIQHRRILIMTFPLCLQCLLVSAHMIPLDHLHTIANWGDSSLELS